MNNSSNDIMLIAIGYDHDNSKPENIRKLKGEKKREGPMKSTTRRPSQ